MGDDSGIDGRREGIYIGGKVEASLASDDFPKFSGYFVGTHVYCLGRGPFFPTGHVHRYQTLSLAQIRMNLNVERYSWNRIELASGLEMSHGTITRTVVALTPIRTELMLRM